MIGERYHRRFPTVDVPPWPYSDNDPTINNNNNSSMQFILSPNTINFDDNYFPYADDDGDDHVDEDDVGDVDVDDDDDFRMYEFKVTRCGRGRSHDWTECPFVHPGEKARRRDPRKYHYSGTACPDFRKGSCVKGDGCEFAHGVFECWLHPHRYRTQPCKDGGSCKRRVCFFAHSPEQLRVVNIGGGGGGGGGGNRTLHLSYSPESSSPPTESPPMSPMTVNSLSRSPVNDVMASLRRLQISRLNSMPLSTNLQLGSPVFGSPRRTITRPGFFSLPVTPSDPTRPGNRCFDLWEKGEYGEEPIMERVESGRGLRAKMFEKLSKENPLDSVDPDPNLNSNPGHNPDVGWVSDLIQ